MSINIKILDCPFEKDFKEMEKYFNKIYKISDDLIGVEYLNSLEYKKIMNYISTRDINLYIIFCNDFLKIIKSKLLNRAENIELNLIKNDESVEYAFEKYMKIRKSDLSKSFLAEEERNFVEEIKHLNSSTDIRNLSFIIEKNKLLNKITIYNNGIVSFDEFSIDLLKEIGAYI